MQLHLEDLPYQQRAIDVAVAIFNGQCVRLADRPLLAEIHANACELSDEQIAAASATPYLASQFASRALTGLAPPKNKVELIRQTGL